MLKETRCARLRGILLGLPVRLGDAQRHVIPRQTPLITTTPYVYEAFLQCHRARRRPRVDGEVLASIARHAATDIKEFHVVRNGQQLLLHSVRPRRRHQRRGLSGVSADQRLAACWPTNAYGKIAERNLNFVLEAQNPDGSWSYAVDGVRDFVDHFHTCFVMKALAKIHALTGHER